MAKLYGYEFVYEKPDGTLSNVHTVMSENLNDALKAIDAYNPDDDLVILQGADPKNYSDPTKVMVGKDKVVEHDISAIIPNWRPASKGGWITSG